MIFDDYGWVGPDLDRVIQLKMGTFCPFLMFTGLTQKGIDGFLSGYHKRINYLGEKESQVFIKKKYKYWEF